MAQFVLGRLFIWIVLGAACALPLATLTWRRFTPTERFAEVLGTCVWVVVMMILGERLRWPSRDDRRLLRGLLFSVMWNRWTSREADRRSKMLRAGALATALVHTGLAIVSGPLGLFLWFAPVVWVVSYLPLASDIESDFWNALVLTLMCGAQSVVVAWLFGCAIDLARRALGGSR